MFIHACISLCVHTCIGDRCAALPTFKVLVVGRYILEYISLCMHVWYTLSNNHAHCAGFWLNWGDCPFSLAYFYIVPTLIVLVPHTGDVRSGKTAIIRRYTQNQFIAAEPCTENKLVELTAHSVQLPGIQEVVSVVFWEIPAHSFNLVKEEQYKGSDAVIGSYYGLSVLILCVWTSFVLKGIYTLLRLFPTVRE